MLRELSRLPRRERTIIANRFGFDGRRPMTFHELGTMLGVSRERARQIEREAINKLRRRLKVPGSAAIPHMPESSAS
jgi:RNA polymerase sigma factor (sigma-70 family)